MGLPSKEEKIIELFFNDSSRHWHFKEIIKEAKISEDRANYWLKQLLKEKLVKHINPRGKMPYFIANFEHPNYKNRKKIFAFNKLYKSGFLSHLYALKNAKAIIIFGSFSRSDWNKKSDIDLFIYGDPKGLNIGRYELALHRDIQLFASKDIRELKKMGDGLMRNIISGNIIKGEIGEDLIKNAIV